MVAGLMGICKVANDPPGTRDETHLHRTIDLQFNSYWKVVLRVYRAAGVHSDGGEYYCRVPQADQSLEPYVWRAETTNIYIYIFLIEGIYKYMLPS